MDPLAGGSAAFPDKDGVSAGGPITSPVSGIADVERNEQVVPLFYLYRRLARDTGGAGARRGGLSAEVALTLGGIKQAQALIMTHGAEAPNSQGLGGGWPGATVRQTLGRGAVLDGRPVPAGFETFGPKPGLMTITNRDVFAVSWQGGGGYGDPLAREVLDVERDVGSGALSEEAARAIYGVVFMGARADHAATRALRLQIAFERVGGFDDDPARRCEAAPIAHIGASLGVAWDGRGAHVVTPAGYILCSGHTRWRYGAISRISDQPHGAHQIRLHDGLAVTTYYCPASGLLLDVSIHERGRKPEDDVIVDLEMLLATACPQADSQPARR
jgi:N-methylhydantoinase B